MGHAARLALRLTALALLAGCSGSVADADSDERRGPRTTAAPASDFCRAVEANSDAARPLSGMIARGSGPTPELLALVEEVRRTNVLVVSTAPGEIRADVERSVQVSTLQLDALAAGGAAAARDPELRAALESDEFVGASERVRDHVAENC